MSRSILITGGTGSFGKELVKTLLLGTEYERIIIFSRDELKQFEMQNQLADPDRRLRFFLGDVRDKDRLTTALKGVNHVVHAAAMKQVVPAEYNPFEAIKTNILGAQNLIEAASFCKVKRVVALSTDKAASPANLYGATKLCADKLFVAANNMFGPETTYANVRYGNVMGSRGSIIPFVKSLPDSVPIPITDVRMTRFSITLSEGVSIVLNTLKTMRGGETVVPKLKSYKLIDLLNVLRPGSDFKVVGIRPGEKLHEEMISEADSLNTIEFDDHYIILPTMIEQQRSLCEYYKKECLSDIFSYNSGENKDFFTKFELQQALARSDD